jgi:hypothetical protein
LFISEIPATVAAVLAAAREEVEFIVTNIRKPAGAAANELPRRFGVAAFAVDCPARK